jgi:hypothetical protein
MKVMIRADMSKMDASIARIMAAYRIMPAPKRAEFAARYDALTKAGAEWVEIETSKDAMHAVIGDDMRRLCAEFGIDP